jgi:hypothetical protein
VYLANPSRSLNAHNKNFALHKTKVPHIKLFCRINRLLEYCNATNLHRLHDLHSGIAE